MQPDPLLLEMQQHFLGALYDETCTGFCNEAIQDTAIEPAARLRIYRNSSTHIHTNALQTVYPAILALVGAEFFDQAASLYRPAYPSTSGNLQDFGEQFPDLLESLTHETATPYLGDVARLEWLRQRTILAQTANTLDAAEVTRRIAQVEGPLSVVLHPSVHCFASAYPVYTLWQYAMQPGDQGLSLPESGERLLLWRETGQVSVAVLNEASFRCVKEMVQGAPLDQAHRLARQQDPDFDLTTCFADLVTQSLIVDISAAATQEASQCD